MNDVLDLDYADPRPPVDLAARARREGLARRRRRTVVRAGAVGGAVGGAAVFVLVTLAVWSGPVQDRQVVAPAATSAPTPVAASGEPSGAPSDSEPTGAPSDSEPPAPPVTVDEADFNRPRGDVHVVMRHDGQDVVIFLSVNGYFCTGYQVPGGASVQMVQCAPLANLPAEGLWNQGVMGMSDETGPAFAAGLVRGDITRVVIETPQGRVDARLADAPGVGQFYWAATGPFSQGEAVRRIAYRGTTEVFSCLGSTCTSTQG